MTDREQQASDALQDIAKNIDKSLPNNMGFTLLVYEFGDVKNRRMMYVSNSNREDVMNAMTEFLSVHKNNTDIFGKDV